MTLFGRQREDRLPIRLPSRWLASLALALSSWGLCGCQTSGPLFGPRQPAAPVAQAPAPPAPNAGFAGPGGNPWEPVPTATAPSAPFSRLADLLRREQEQGRLASEQKSALAQLAEYQRGQEMQMAQLAQQKQQDAMRKLQEQAAMVRSQTQELEQLAELRRRALELDANNRELNSQLAQTEQQKRVLEDQTRLLQTQLNDTANQLQNSLVAQQQADQRVLQAQQDADRQLIQARREARDQVSTMQASLQRRGSATITANSSLRRNLTPISIAGLLVRQDGDVIRIELPSDQVFSPGTANLNGNAQMLVDQVAGSIRQHYPNQIIGVEAHTDNGSVQGGGWNSHHQLTTAQGMAVFDQLSQRHNFSTQQLFIVGHGANYPVASNATPQGQERNRRVEIVVYPEAVGQRR